MASRQPFARLRYGYGKPGWGKAENMGGKNLENLEKPGHPLMGEPGHPLI
jgi:hypothetical protein